MPDYIFFDLDNTLYPKSLGIFDRIVERIRGYMEVRLGFEKALAREMRNEYLRKYGSTLRGLIIHQQVDALEYLDYVHDVGVEKILTPNPGLAEILESIPCPKAIFTSSHRSHAEKVLRCLGVEEFFPHIFDILFTNHIPKPNPEPYLQILECLGIEGRRCMMIEDLAANLVPAKKLGMETVLVGETPGGMPDFVDYEIRDILELRKVLKN